MVHINTAAAPVQLEPVAEPDLILPIGFYNLCTEYVGKKTNIPSYTLCPESDVIHMNSCFLVCNLFLFKYERFIESSVPHIFLDKYPDFDS